MRKNKNIAQQRLQEMAKNVVNSHFSSARNFILVENMQLRSSPLLVAAKRYGIVYQKPRREEEKIKNKIFR